MIALSNSLSGFPSPTIRSPNNRYPTKQRYEEVSAEHSPNYGDARSKNEHLLKYTMPGASPGEAERLHLKGQYDKARGAGGMPPKLDG